MAINLYTVQEEAAQRGWTLLSEKYQNLKTPMLWKCPYQHEVEMTYGDWRATHNCPECNKSILNNVQRNKILPKRPGQHRVLALDAATGTTGWAIFDDKKLTSYGAFDTIYNENSTARINQVKVWLQKNLDIWQPDAVGVENIQLQQNVKMFQTLANLQGVILDTLYENNIQFILASSSTWRSYCGLNNADKRQEAKQKAQNWVQSMYGIKPTQDEADAICMGKYFISQLRPNRKNIIWGEDIE